MEIIRGNVPDILEVSMINWEMLVSKGLWADLYGFMEQDGECRKDMLMPNVAEAYELDGHLYCIAPASRLKPCGVANPLSRVGMGWHSLNWYRFYGITERM